MSIHCPRKISIFRCEKSSGPHLLPVPVICLSLDGKRNLLKQKVLAYVVLDAAQHLFIHMECIGRVLVPPHTHEYPGFVRGVKGAFNDLILKLLHILSIPQLQLSTCMDHGCLVSESA